MQRGIVLPVVLVMLLMMTVTVIFLMRRGTVDERIAFNVRQVTTLDTATQHALRTCERQLWCALNGNTACASPPRLPAPAASSTAAWRGASNWNSVVILADGATEVASVFGPDVQAARCLIEDATAELETIGELDRPDDPLKLGVWRKYRITAEVVGTSGTIGRAQTEVRRLL
jgi:Tfp pilus assembly protein PilX